jgi:CHASE2 domain-containing sensor protein/tRNA A-37 threonylcarbamoyl transferase component Bud32
MPKNFSSYALYLLITILVLCLYLGDFTGLRKIQWKIDDLMYTFRGEETPAPEIVLVNIDDTSCENLGDWPWSYDLLADLVATCNSGKPKTMLLNFDLASRVSEDTSGNTRVLANQLSWVDDAILTYDFALAEYSHQRMSKPDYLYKNSLQTRSDLGVLNENAAVNIRRPILPSGVILQYADGLGFSYMEYDPDRKVRWAPLLANYDGFYYPSAPLLAAASYLGFTPDDITISGGKSVQFGAYTVPTDKNGRVFINYSDPGTTFTNYSAFELLKGQVDPANLKNKLVIIGVTATGTSDEFNTPVEANMSRSEVFANIIGNIMHNDYITRFDVSTGLNLLILFAFGVFCAVILPRVSLLYRLVILFVCLFILANLSFIMFNSYNILMNSLYLALEIVLFLMAAPLLDKARFAEGGFSLQSLTGRRSGQGQLDFSAAPNLKAAPIRNLQDRKDDPEFEETEHISPEERSRSAVNPSAPAETETTALDSTPPPRSSSSGEDEWGWAGSAAPLVEQPLEESSESAPPEQESLPDRISEPALPEQEPLPEITSGPAELSSSSHSGTGGDKERLTHLGRYQVIEVIGKGAMGTVFKGIDPAINRPVALKTIRLDFVSDQSEMEELRDRLTREARAAGMLSHPNIVTIYDIGAQDDLHYIAMEYLQGQTLEDLIKRKVQFSYKIIASIISQICTALQYAHEQGIVHRDIKPANIMVLSDYTVKVMDFGIARVDSSSLTRTGIAMGTPNYIAPELLQGKPVDRRCDIFSVGVVIYELLTGRRPFKGENLTSLIYSIINDNPPAPSKINDNLPLIFDHIVDKALKKNPTERYQKASDLKGALADFIDSFGGVKKIGI